MVSPADSSSKERPTVIPPKSLPLSDLIDLLHLIQVSGKLVVVLVFFMFLSFF